VGLFTKGRQPALATRNVRLMLALGQRGERQSREPTSGPSSGSSRIRSTKQRAATLAP
jgi:hypothetical protein